MRASYRDRAYPANRSERGTGSLRERSPGVREVRVVTGSGPGRGRSIQRSFTVHGDAALAGQARRELVAEYGLTCAGLRHAAPAVTVGELLESYLWSVQFVGAGTAVSHRHVVSTLLDDPLFRCRQQCLTPAVMRAAICRRREEGVSVPKVPARWLLLRSAVSWAVAEGLLRLNPLAGMRGVTGSASSGPETAAGPFSPAGGRRGADGAGDGGRRREIRMQGMTWPPA